MAGLTWLHLSDWHQMGMDFDREVVRDALVDDIKNRRNIDPGLEKIDFIVFSGDLAYKGKKEEYEAAAKHFLQPVLKAANLDESRLFIVPGNHDLDRDSFELLPPRIQKPLTDAEDIKKWLEIDEKRERMLAPFKTFNEFVKVYGGSSFSCYAGSHQLNIEGKKIALFGFNSALMCGRNKNEKNEVDDKGKIIVGEPQVYEILRKNQEADLRIVVLHHPFDWLTEQDCIPVETRLKQGTHFILCGHQHRPKVTIETGTDGDCIIIPAGASYDRRKAYDQQFNNAYNFVHLDFENQNGTVYLRCWSDRQNNWREDIDAYRDGRFAFPLPKESIPVTGTKPSTGIVPPEAPVKTVTLSLGTIGATGTAVNYHPDNPVFNVPFRAKGNGMVGREEVLQQVRKQLTAGQPTAIGHTAVFQGLGGLGKTQLAVEYAHRFRNDYPLGVIWINADQEIEPQLIQIAKQGRWIHPESKPQDILEIAKQRLQTRSNCLIIFDNVEEQEAIEPYLPAVDAEPHLLLTSRAVQKGFVSIDISLLDEELSLQLLLKESGREINSLSEHEQKAAYDIAVSLGGLPLAIEIAGAYLNHLKSCSFQNYKDFLDKNLQDAMNGNLLSSFTRHEENLFLTLQISKSVLEQAPLLNDILDILAWSGTAFMGSSLLGALLDKTEAELFNPLQLGVSLRLLQKSSGVERYDIHRLVRRVRQVQWPIIKREQWIKDTCQRLGDWFEERRTEFNQLPFFEAEMDHLKQWLEHVKSYQTLHSARLTWLQAYPPYHWGQYREVRQLVQEAFKLLSNNSEDDLKLKANILNDIGFVYSQFGELSKALENLCHTLEIRKQLFGENHPDTATSFNNVGYTYGEMGDHEKALEYMLKALEIQQKLLGGQHPDTAASFSNVGTTYGRLGDHKKALEFQLEALEIEKKLLGDQHPATATSFNNVGTTYGEMGDRKKALKYKLKALEIQQKLLGDQHPDTAASFNNVGTTYGEMGDHKKALEYQLEALEIRQKLLGDQHPDTAASFNNVGTTYSEMGDHKKALEYQLKALEIRQKLLGDQHPDTAASFNNVGTTYGRLGDHKKALKYKLKALEIRQQLFGDQHPDTAISLYNIGGIYFNLGKTDEALGYFIRAFDIAKNILGEFHQNTAKSLKNLIFSLIKLKRFQEAGEHLDKYLEHMPQDHKEYKDFLYLKKLLQNEKRKGMHGIPGKKKKKK